MSATILAVEDQTDIREQLSQLLEDAGYIVHAVSDPDDAMVLLRTLPRPCILLWDAMMPRHSLTLLDQATLRGVSVAALPVSVSAVHTEGETRRIEKRLTSEEAILSIVRAHCPRPEMAIA